MNSIKFYKKWQFWTSIGGIVVILFAIMISGNINSGNHTTNADSTTKSEKVSKNDSSKSEESSKDNNSEDDDNSDGDSDDSDSEILKKLANKSKKEFVASDYRTDITFDNLARTPKSFVNQPLTLTGTVSQVIEDDDATQIRLAVNGDYDSIVLCTFDTKILNNTHILEDDNLTIYGYSFDLTSYESTTGEQITIPSIGLTHIQNNGKTDY